MALLDRVLEIEDEHIVVELTVRDDGLFSNASHQVPAWVGLEYMAQTIAAFSGYHRKCRGEAVDLGFLLGTRFYQCSVSAFSCGSTLRVRADKAVEGSPEMSVFDCKIEDGQVLASARLNVYLPKFSKQFLATKGL